MARARAPMTASQRPRIGLVGGAIEPTTLLESGMPLSTVRGGPHDGMPLITKPGAHGDSGCLGHLVGVLRALQASGRPEKVVTK